MKKIISLWCFIYFLKLSPGYSMARVNPDIGAFLSIGRGYDIVSGNTAANCIVPKTPIAVSPGVGEVSAHISYINDYESLAKSLEISSSTNVKIGMPAFKFNLDATSKFFSEQKIDEESVYFMVEISVKMPMEQIEKVELDENYKKLLVSEGGAEAFREACGDEYVDAIQKGGKLYGLVKITSASKEEKKQLEILIKGKAGKAFSTNLSLKQSLKEIAKKYNYELFFTQVGGLAKDLPISSSESLDKSSLDNFDKLFTQAEEFAKDLAKDKSGVTIMSNTASYKQTINYPAGVSPVRAANKVNIIEKYSQFRFSILKVLNYLDSIMMNPDDYEKINDGDFAKINEVRDQYIKNMDILNEFADNCFYNITDCKIPASTDGFILSPYPKIKRINGSVETFIKIIPVEPPFIDPTPKKCIKKLYKEGSGEVCGIERAKTGRSEVCGVELYNEKKDIICGITPKSVSLPMFFKVNSCRHPNFGVESYKVCEHESFGVIYRVCRHESFGEEGCLEWEK